MRLEKDYLVYVGQANSENELVSLVMITFTVIYLRRSRARQSRDLPSTSLLGNLIYHPPQILSNSKYKLWGGAFLLLRACALLTHSTCCRTSEGSGWSGPTSSSRTESPAGISSTEICGGCDGDGGAISTSLWINPVDSEVRTFLIEVVSSSCQSVLDHASPYFFVRFSTILDYRLVLPCYFVFLCQYLRLQAKVYLPLINHFAQLFLQVICLRIAMMKLSIALLGASVGTALAEVPHIVAKVSEHED